MTGRLLLVLTCAVASACAKKNPTWAEACDAIAEAQCERRFTCTKSEADRTSCLHEVHAVCCTGDACLAPVPDNDRVARCIEALQSHSCSLLAQGRSPDDCPGSPQ